MVSYPTLCHTDTYRLSYQLEETFREVYHTQTCLWNTCLFRHKDMKTGIAAELEITKLSFETL